VDERISDRQGHGGRGLEMEATAARSSATPASGKALIAVQ
jgi:hypothetical protein